MVAYIYKSKGLNGKRFGKNKTGVILEKLYLIKIGEIALKGGNRNFFEKRLKKNIKLNLRSIKCSVYGGRGRFFLETHSKNSKKVEDALSKTFGIKGFSVVRQTEKNIDKIIKEAVAQAQDNVNAGKGIKFKVNSRRADKGFSFNSYKICCMVGDAILNSVKDTSVDLYKPDWSINIEIRETAYIYGYVFPGPGGLPVGSAGGGLLLLSGGIDSPVAGWLMSKRGLKVDAIYFHTYPYTSDEAKQKVIDLAERLSRFTCGLDLYIVPFTNVQLKINKDGFEKSITLLMRHAMVSIAERIAEQRGKLALITGEALSQVASQTAESIRFTASATNLPIFRPCIGMDKEEIINLAEKIDTYSTSIIPHEDCCTLFAPEHPITHPDFEKMNIEYQKLELNGLIEEAVAGTEKLYLDGGIK